WLSARSVARCRPHRRSASGSDEKPCSSRVADAMRDTSASASAQLGAACSRCLLVDLELPGVLPITELDAVDGRRPLDRDPTLEHALENATRVAVKRVPVASTPPPP